MVTQINDTFRLQKGLRLKDRLSPLLFNSALAHAIIKVQYKQESLELNGSSAAVVR